MKITNPFVLLGLLIVAIVAVLAMVEATKAPPAQKTVRVETSADVTSEVVVSPSNDAAKLTSAIAALSERDKRWKDSVDLGSRTARIGLSPIVQDMQEQVRENEKFEVPDCLSPAKAQWIESQREVVKGLLAFMGKEEAASTNHLDTSVRARRNYEMLLDACRPSPP